MNVCRYLFVITLVFVSSCSTYSGKYQYKKALVSWYGKQYHGKKTASGETYNMRKLTAAHKTLPFGTRVKMVNPQNNKHIIVQITDRGPFVPGREFDLSRKAFNKLAPVSKGILEVRYKILHK